MQLWDFLEGRTLFESVDPRIVEDYDDETHLSYITSLLGPAPKDFVRHGKRTSMVYTDAGKRVFQLNTLCIANTAF
jgi:hypothetical protein